MSKSHLPRRAGLVLSVVIAATAIAPAAAKPANPPDCRDVAAAAEPRHGIPLRLLAAISLAETGRWDRARRARIAWPWTVYAEGRGRFLPDKASAVAEVKALQARGVRNIDVGCMQVNLKYHPKAFASLEEALEPASNVAFAAGFLTRLRQDHRSWSVAVARYHSSTRALNRPYRRKVMKLWHEERWRYYRARHAAARAAAAERRRSRGRAEG